jgi:PAS domain S-box-containing protein
MAYETAGTAHGPEGAALDRGAIAEMMRTLEQLPIAAFVAADPLCLKMWANEAAHRLLGTSPRQNVSKTALPEARPKEFRELRNGAEIAPEELPLQRAVFENTSIANYEFQIERADGSKVDVSVNALPLTGPDGRVRGGIATMFDLTAWREAEQRVRNGRDALARTIDELQVLVCVTGPDGSVRSSNRALDEYTGQRPRGLAGWDWAATVHPDDYRALLGRWAIASTEKSAFEIEARLRRHDGIFRWFLLRARPHLGGDAPAGWYVTATDIEDLKQASAAVRSNELRFRRLLESNILAMGIASNDGFILDANDALLQLLGRTHEEIQNGLRWDAITPPEWADHDARAVAALRASGVAPIFEKEYLRPDGSRVPVTLGVARLPSEPGEKNIFYALDLTDVKRAEIVQRALADAGRLTGLLGVEGVARELAAIAVRYASESCTVCLSDREGQLRAVHTAHRDPAHAPAVESGTLVSDADPHAAAWKRGEPVFTSSSASPRGVYVPLLSGSSAVGSIGFLDSTRASQFDRRDLLLLESLAARGAAAIKSAQLYDRERRIARALQEGQLPRILPDVPGYRISASYIAGRRDEAEIGGDWYDVFALPDGRIGMSIGDVLGNGLVAALAMGKVRQAMQAAAFVRGDVLDMLAAAEYSLQAHDSDAIATALAAILEPQSGLLRFASSGHPFPIVARGRRIEPVRADTAPALGVTGVSSTGAIPAALTIEPGTRVVFYTDGLVESTRNILEGERRLADEVAAAAAGDADLAGSLHRAFFPASEPADDVAILTIARE